MGFALETDDAYTNARDKLERKNLDFIVLNSMRDKGAGFGYDTNKVTLIDSNQEESLPLMSKRSVAAAIVKKLAKLFIMFLLFIMPSGLKAQELDAQVSFNISKIQGTERSIFTSLQNAVQELLRNQSWTDYHFTENERIQCVFTFTVNKYDQSTGQMECELIVQSNRPVYNSSYYTTVFNFRDPSVDFAYTEQDRLDYVPGSVNNNLVAVLAYYSLLIIGLDFDTMSLNGGTDILRRSHTHHFRHSR